MRQRLLVTSTLILAVAALLGLGPALTSAQDGTPTADPFAGVTIEALGSAVPSAAPDDALVLLRLTMEPGANIPAHSHPGPVVLYVDSGTFGTTWVEGEGQLTRAAMAGTPAAAEPVTAGAELILESGDTLAYEGAVHTMANAGDEPLVLLVSALLVADQPGFLFAEATPAP